MLPDISLQRTCISLPLPHGQLREFSFESDIGLGFDEIISACVQVVEQMIEAGRPEPYGIKTIIENGLRQWFAFCGEYVAQTRTHLTLASVDRALIDAFVAWLSSQWKVNGEKWSMNTSRTVYAKTKTVLNDLCVRRLLPPADAIFPPNPFPRATALENRRAYIRPLSDLERERLIGALAPEVGQVFDGTHPSSQRIQITLCVFAILLKTGLNPTPLLELPRNLSTAFMDHPRANRKVLVTFKRRAGGGETTTPLQPANSAVVALDIYRLIQKVAELTTGLAASAESSDIATRLWLTETQSGGVRGLYLEDLSGVASDFTRRHKLKRDDGTPLKMTSQLFRNTKINRIWRASRGDLLATAKSVGNTPAVSNGYLDATPDMLEEHRHAGEVMVNWLEEAGRAALSKTPVASCRDPYDGERAPRNGKACIDFLSCFRCKSQVIVGDDLYRLFSFYWAVLREREIIGAPKWRKVLAWIVRIIDRDIAPRFAPELVDAAKTRARHDPHPMWRSREALWAIGCWRRPNLDHLCRLNLDQGSEAVRGAVSCG
jgi:hypothetical protein